MENWGLITFREVAVLVADTASVVDRMRVAITIAHEMAHLWFGASLGAEFPPLLTCRVCESTACHSGHVTHLWH